MKTHLAESPVPLTEGQSVKSLCGEKVPNSIFTFRWIGGEIEISKLSTLLTCRHCVAKMIDDAELPDRLQKIPFYLYGVQNRAEMKPNQLEKLVGREQESA